MDKTLFNLNLAEYLLDNDAANGTTVVAGPGNAWAYGELVTKVNALSYALSRRYAKATPIGVLAGNSPLFILAYLAILKSGNVAILLDRNAQPEILADEIERTKARHVLVETNLVRKLEGLDVESWTEDTIGDMTQDAIPKDWPQQFLGSDRDLAVIFFTSGTTAKRKGVMLSHRNIIANTESIIEYLSLGADERACVVLPFHHIGGISVLNSHLRIGGSFALYNGIFAGSVVDGIINHECTSIFGVPSTFALLVREMGFSRQQYPRLRYIAQGGGIMAEVLLKELREGLPEVDIVVSYGQTEAASRLSYLPPHLLPAKLGSIGKDVPGIRLAVVDENGKNVQPGEIGEIIAQGESIMIGYLGDEEATKQTIVNGWLHTRDAATVDEDGYIYPKYRLDGVINSGGYRVSPEEIEGLVQSHPAIAHCGAIGVPDVKLGEAIALFFSTNNADDSVLEDIRALCKSKLPSHKRPKFIKAVEALPLNSSTKLDREALRLRAGKEFADT